MKSYTICDQTKKFPIDRNNLAYHPGPVLPPGGDGSPLKFCIARISNLKLRSDDDVFGNVFSDVKRRRAKLSRRPAFSVELRNFLSSAFYVGVVKIST